MNGIGFNKAADRLGVTPRYARELLKQGKLTLTDHGAIDERSLETYRQHRLPAGRPTTLATSAALALLLRGGKPDLPARSLARLRNSIRNAGPWDLALDLLHCPDEELAQLAELIINPETFLQGRRAQAQLKELQLHWIHHNPIRQGESFPLALIGLKSSAQVAKLIKSSDFADERRRIVLDHIADLLSTTPEFAQALIAQPATTGHEDINAILNAGISWAARIQHIPVPSWVSILPLSELLWSELMPADIRPHSEWIPEFRSANIYAEPAHFVRA